jgi:pimeloyl-ACP methyl ester carboxylesterase
MNVPQPAANNKRTINEIKVEAQARAERGAYPLIGLDPTDVREALAHIGTRDADEWSSAWSAVADHYYGVAKESSNAQERRSNYLRAWRLYYFAQWPVASSEGKKAAYNKALDSFIRSTEALSPPLEIVRIPFEGSEIVGYMRMPGSRIRRVPVVLAVSGLDSRKENLAETYGILLDHGIGFFTIDGPGTGQSPVKASPTADRILSRVIDYLAARDDVDPSRILLHGVSFGGYWASKLAIVEKDRLRAVVVQSPPIHGFFQPDSVRNSLLGNREYLFDVVPTFLSVVENVSTVDDLIFEFPKLSLVALGLLGRPTTSMLVIAGVKDTLVPISDIDLLLHNGDVPKDAWINPKGGHLGRELTHWTDPMVFREVIMPWELRVLQGA